MNPSGWPVFAAHGPLKSPARGAPQPWQPTATADCDGRERFWIYEIYGRSPGRLCAAMQYGFLFIFQKGIGAAIE